MLKPYTVLDLTDERGEIGPMVLGDLGANVIRVEPPGGTAARACGPFVLDAPDDLKSLQFLAFNRNKRSILLDPDSSEDNAALRELIRRADFIFESVPPRYLAAYGLDFESARRLNSRIVYVRISPFGDDGPYANYLGGDLVLAAMGGPVSLQGAADGPPVRITAPQVWRHTGVEAAAGAMAAHARMQQCGEAQFVDVSAQCVMTWTMLNAMDAHGIQGYDFNRGDSGMGGGQLAVRLVYPTLDGFIVALPLSSVLQGCAPWIIADGIVDASIMDIDWDEYDLNVATPESAPMTLAEGIDICRRFFANHTKHELFEFGLQHGITLAPVNDLAELLALPHLQARGYWRDLELPDGRIVQAPGMWSKSPNAEFADARRAPALDEHGEAIRRELQRPFHPPAQPPAADNEALPFAGVRVADFSWVGVGPISAKYLADHGADVIRVESENRLDVLRGGAPFKDAEAGINRSQFFGDFNTSKQSLTLDMKSADAIEIAKRLIAVSDVMIESFAAGAIGRMGLGYDDVRKINPGVIMISTCLMGQSGPAAGLAGYGYHAAAIAGFYELTGSPHLPPSGPWIAYTDTIAPRFISVLVAAALDHRRRTGEGCFIDAAQIETALHFLSPELFDLQANGFAATRSINRSRFAAPQGCYRCAGKDDWCAIGVDTDAQWQALCREIGREEWSTSLAGLPERLAAHDEIDAAINDWTSAQEHRTVMQRLQAAGVPAGVVQRSSDLLTDPQYAHRHFYRYLEHPEMGLIPYAGHQYRIYGNGPRAPAPLLGEHSFTVLSELLGLTDDEIGAAYASGAIN